MPTFGQVIATARKSKGLSLQQLAAQIKKEDDRPISPAYLNDIEHGRRNPPTELLLQQLALVLGLDLDYLHYLAGELPPDLVTPEQDPAAVAAAFAVFRKTLRKGGRQP